MNIPAPKIAVLGFLLHLTLLACPSHAAPGDVDLSFDSGSGIDGPVSTVAVQADGKIIIGGSFRTVNGLVRIRIARLNADGSGDAGFHPDRNVTGSLDPAFNPFNDAAAVQSVVLQPDGKIVVAGNFTALNGTDRTPIVRLNTDGSRDGSFDSAIGTHNNSGGIIGSIRAITLQPDGRILIVGLFYTPRDATNKVVARLNADGSLDSSFTPGTAAYLTNSATVRAVAVQPDGKVLIGGYLTAVNGTAREGIARLNANGSVDTSFNPDPGTITRRAVYSIVVQPDGKVFFGGYSSLVSNNKVDNVVRLNANGNLDNTFSSGAPPSGGLNSVALQPDGKLLISSGGPAGVARLHANGSLDNSFNPGTGADGQFYGGDLVTLQSDGKVIVAGHFGSFNGAVRIRMTRLNADGSLDSSFNPGAGVSSGVNSATVYALAAQSDGKVLIAGYFDSVNGTSRNRITRLNANGSLDSSFDPGTGIADGNVRSLAVQPDGKVVIGGDFTVINGTARNYIARLNSNGTLDSTFNPGFGPDNVVFAVALQSDGKVLIGGWFTTINGTLRNKIARLNSDGSLDTTFGTGTGGSGNVYAIAVQPDGKVIRGGDYIARLKTTGSLDATFDPGTGVDNSVEAVVLQPDGKLLIGGYFNTVNGTVRNGFARLDADGALDAGFSPVTITGGNIQNGTSVNSISLQFDGKVLIGGSFDTVNNTGRNGIARFHADGSLDSTFNPIPGVTGGGLIVYCTAIQPDGKLLIGGDFTMVNDAARWSVARLMGDSVLPTLDIVGSNAAVIVSWPVTGLNFQLQETTDVSLSNSWSPVAQPAVTNAGQISVTVPTTVERKFFRLKLQ